MAYNFKWKLYGWEIIAANDHVHQHLQATPTHTHALASCTHAYPFRITHAHRAPEICAKQKQEQHAKWGMLSALSMSVGLNPRAPKSSQILCWAMRNNFSGRVWCVRKGLGTSNPPSHPPTHSAGKRARSPRDGGWQTPNACTCISSHEMNKTTRTNASQTTRRRQRRRRRHFLLRLVWMEFCLGASFQSLRPVTHTYTQGAQTPRRVCALETDDG